MAYVRLKPNSWYWYAGVNMPDGTQRCFSTRLTNEADALQVAITAENSTRRLVGTPDHLGALRNH